MRRLVRETNEPDILCLQEARLRSSSASSRGKPMESDLKTVEAVLSSAFTNYDAYWSLADQKRAGTLTLLHKRLQFDPATNNNVAYSPDSAIDLLLDQLDLTRQQVGLPEATSKNVPSTAPSKRKAAQTSMTSFFAPKGNNHAAVPKKKKEASQTTMGTFFGKRPAPPKSGASKSEHTEEGRFQFFFFGDMDLVQTYVPNNGYKKEQFERRRLWDESMLKFLLQRQQILQHVNKSRRLLWTGDLNCAMDHRDGTHWETSDNGSIVEWWTQEKKCFSKSQKVCENRTSEEIGMPSFTPGERSRFTQLVAQGNLVDVWRNLHPNGSSKERSGLSQWEHSDMTWRGSLSANGWSRYEGKGQRIDYFLLSKSDVDAVVSCEILGYGTQRVGFCGSDHSPVSLVLKNPSDEASEIKELTRAASRNRAKEE